LFFTKVESALILTERRKGEPKFSLSFAVQAQFVNRSVFVFACGLNVVQSERIRSV
jgi:hypothetical protein